MTIAVKRRHLTIRRWLSEISSGEGESSRPSVLIIGCGTIPLPGIRDDWRIVNLEVERKLFPNLVLYDGSVFPFADASFDIVLCLDVIEHVQNDDSMLGEIARVLKCRRGGGDSYPYHARN